MPETLADLLPPVILGWDSRTAFLWGWIQPEIHQPLLAGTEGDVVPADPVQSPMDVEEDDVR